MVLLSAGLGLVEMVMRKLQHMIHWGTSWNDIDSVADKIYKESHIV